MARLVDHKPYCCAVKVCKRVSVGQGFVRFVDSGELGAVVFNTVCGGRRSSFPCILVTSAAPPLQEGET